MQTATKYQDYLDAFYALAQDKPEILQAVFEKVTDACREVLVLQFASKCLFFHVDLDDDTIQIQCKDMSMLSAADYSRVGSGEPWRALIGSEFGWGWVTINQQGYCDGALLSFDGILPSVLLSVSASSLTVSRIIHEERGAGTASAGKNGS